jgi:heavy metal sensor kinase
VKKQSEIAEGIKFIAKDGFLKIVVYDRDGKQFFFNEDYKDEFFCKKNYPVLIGTIFTTQQWVGWTKWDTDLYYSGENCYIKINDLQQIEIAEDILLFFFVSLPIIAVLSLIGGAILGSAATRHVRRVECAAQAVANGDLTYRIPETSSNDEMMAMGKNLNRMFAELEHSFKRIMEFSSDLAHELRTPLTVMTGELEVALRETRTSEEYQDVLVRTMEEVAFLKRLINDMLILLKPDSAYSNENFESVDFSLLLLKSVEFLEMLADTKNITILKNIQDDIKLNANSSLLRMLIYNLIHNAIKYTGDQGEVTITLSKEKKKISLSVSDNGPGIPEADHENIFKRFFRLGRDKEKQSSGTGLGLTIVRKVCDVHCAEIKVNSSESGSTFTVVFNIPPK